MAYVADVLEARGMAKGMAKGMAEGLVKGYAEGLVKVLEGRFGPIPDTVEQRIHAADKSELDRLLGKAVVIPSLDELFSDCGGDWRLGAANTG